MQLNVTPKVITFTGNKEQNQPKSRKREQVETAAQVTGGAGASVAATRGPAMKFFNTAKNFNNATDLARQTTRAMEVPARQTNSLFNAFRLNYKSFTEQIAKWAKTSKMPSFIKPIFTGGLGKLLGRFAAIFVFVTGFSEVVRTVANNIYKVGATYTPAAGMASHRDY